MQRRVAAVYLVFFLVMGASAFSVIAVAEAPTVDVEGQTYEQGDSLTVDGRTYEVAAITAEESEESGTTVSGQLAWTNESARFDAVVANNTTHAPAQVSWEGQAARSTATLADGDEVSVNGSEAVVSIPASGANVSLVVDGNVTATLVPGDSFTYRGNETTVDAVSADGAELVWGESYRLAIANASNPDSFTMVQEFDVAARLAADSAVENRTVTRDDGRRYVVYRADGTTEPLAEYLPTPARTTFREGDSLTFAGNETRVANVSATEVTLEWTGTRTNTVGLENGVNVTLVDQQFVATFPDEETVMLSTDVAGYRADLARQDSFKERQNGLWGVTILSGVAAVFIVGLAYLPVKG
jgi:hypothetical protein